MKTIQRKFNHRVLLVEDSPESENLIRQICEKVDSEMHLKCVDSAEKAKEILEENSGDFDLVIADHYLNGPMTGLDLWKACRKKLHKVPFIMTSSLSADQLLKLTEGEWDTPLLF